MITQIYGITCAGDAALVNALGPDHVGVVLDEGIATWDTVAAPVLREILAELRDVAVVALSLSTERARILRTLEAVRPAWLHLARAADGGIPPALVAQLRAEIAPVRLMVTIPVRDASALEESARFVPCADALLLDSAHPTTGLVGATGHTHDWSVSRRIAERVPLPVILAGGLGPDNVTQAIRAARPAGVDSETRTSRDDDRRRKHPERVRLFIERARAARAGPSPL